MKRILLKLFKFFGIGIAIIAILLVIVSLAGIIIPLDFLKGPIQKAAQDTLGRELLIDGSIGLSPGLTPEVFIEGVKLANSGSGSDSSFAAVDELSLQVHLLPLLGAKIHVGDVNLNGVSVDLVRPKTGEANWVFDLATADDTDNKAVSHNDESWRMRLVAIDSIQLSDFVLSYRNESTQTHYDLKLVNAVARAPEAGPTSLEVEGLINTLPITLNLESDPLQNMAQRTFPLTLKLASRIGSAGLEAIINVLDSGIKLSVDLQGKDLNQLNEKLGLRLPAVQNYQASASIDYDESELIINTLQANFDDSVINAELKINHEKRPLAISGIVDIRSLDLKPFLEPADDSGQPSTGQASGQITADENTKADELSSLVKQLSDYSADISVNIGRLSVGDIVVTDSNLLLNLADGKLNTPIGVVFNGVPMQGNFSLHWNTVETTVTAKAFLEVRNNDIGDLEQWLNLDGIDGSLGKFSLRAQTSGDSLQSLLEQLSTNLILEGADLRYGDSEQAEAVTFSLERLSASVAVEKPLTVNIKGELLDQSFTVDFTGGKLQHLVTGAQWPLKMTAKGAGAELNIDGTVGKTGGFSGSNLNLSLSGSKLGDMHAWLGISRGADIDYKLQALASSHLDGWQLSSYEVGLGDTKLKGKLSATKSPDGMLIDAEILSELINLPELTSLFDNPNAASKQAINTGEKQNQESERALQLTESTLAIPILPKGIVLADADIEVLVNELQLEDMSLTDIKFHGSVRDGILSPSPFSMHLGETIFFGDIAFDSVSTPPSTSLNVETRNIDIGDLLDEFEVANGIDLSADLFNLKMDLKGHRLGDILNRSSIAAEIRQGEWVLTDPGSGLKFPLELQHGTLTMEPNSPARLTSEAGYKGQQIAVSITIDQLLTKKTGENVSLEIDVQYDDNAMSFKGTSPLPINIKNTVMSLDMNGTNTGSLRTITGLPVPQLGPYKLAGRFTTDSQGYYLEVLQAQLGESVVEGSAALRTNLSVPEFDVQLVSEHFQLNDFHTPKSSSSAGAVPDAPAESESRTTSDSAETKTDNEQVNTRWDTKYLALANGSFNLRAKEVVSGNDWLGEGEINFELRDRKLDVAPIKVKLPGGNIDASMSMFAKDEDLDVSIKAMVNQFDYGILARRDDPETKMSGVIDLDIALETTVQSADRLLANGYGYIDFVVLPKYFEAGSIDLWATTLLAAVLPRLGSDVSLINCLIARFDIKDGLMTEKELYLDTSKLRATGKGEINFKDQTISYILKPKAKNPGVFQVQPPLKIDGSFANLQLGLDGGILGTALGTAATTLTAPIRILMGKDVPENGSDICIPLASRADKQK